VIVRSVARAVVAAALVCAGCDDAAIDSSSRADAAPDAGDARAPGVAHDASPATDAGDPGSSCAAGCPPAITFTPKWIPPTGAHQDRCTAGQIAAFYDECLSANATSTTCAPFGPNGDSADRACAACLVTPSTDAAWGPLVQDKGVVNVNLAGCVALLDVAGGVACAKAEVARAQCDETYGDAYCCCNGGAASACFAGANASFRDLYDAVAPVFCGAAPTSDAGVAD
jgi:hypothetical protein